MADPQKDSNGADKKKPAVAAPDGGTKTADARDKKPAAKPAADKKVTAAGAVAKDKKPAAKPAEKDEPAEDKEEQKADGAAAADDKDKKNGDGKDKEKVKAGKAPKAPKPKPSLPGIWGIDLGQCALKAIRLEVVDGEMTATAFDYIEHPKILSQPDADPDQLTREALDKFLSRNNLRGDTVVISVPGQSGLARFVKLPPVEEKKIEDIVKFEAKQQIPFPLEEVVWDYQKLGAGLVTDGFALETEVGLFAMKRDMVSRYLQHFQDVGVEVHIVQMAPLALVNFVAHDLIAKPRAEGAAEDDDGGDSDADDEGGGKRQCVVALDIGTDNSNLVITDGDKIIWQRPIPIGGNHFTRALTKDLKLTFAKAEHLKRNAVKSPDLKKILTALRPVLNDFVSEVQRSLGYFTNTHRDAHIKYMIGLGNAFRLPGLQKFLQEKLQLEVRKLTEIKRLKGESVLAAPQFTENILSFAVAHGLALQGLKESKLQTNLLPPEIRVERIIRAKKPWAAAAAAALLLGVAGLALGRSAQDAAWSNPKIETALKEGSGLVEQVKKFESAYQAAESEATKAQETVRSIAAGAEERFNWPLLYQYVNEALPRPDGQRLAQRTETGRVNAKQKYYVDGGRQAFEWLRQRRASGGPEGVPSKDELKKEDDVLKNLVQINIEGIVPLWSEDLPAQFFNKLKEKEEKAEFLTKKGGMRPADAEQIKKGDDKLPKKGWIVEIRGFTYHKHAERFVIDTLVENLASPETAGFKPPPTMKQQVRDKIGYVFLFDRATSTGPSFKLIGSSPLRTVLTVPSLLTKATDPSKGMATAMPMEGMGGGMGGDAPGGGARAQTPNQRAAWRPLGEVAGASVVASTGLAGGELPGGIRPGPGVSTVPAGIPGMPGAEGGVAGNAPPARIPRTEFVVFFIWDEPLTPEGAAQP